VRINHADKTKLLGTVIRQRVGLQLTSKT